MVAGVQGNTNRLLAINTIILYIRLFVVSVSGLLSTRYALQALGESDFGLFGIIGSIITFMNIINTMMLSSSNRFIATAIGRGCPTEMNSIFSVTVIVHLVIALLTLVIALPFGHLYINNFLNYDGNIDNALLIFNINIVSSAISFIGVPYNGLLLSKERFWLFCSVDIISSILKLVGCYILIYHFNDKLLIYALIIAFNTIYPTFIFYFYCNHAWKNITKIFFVRDWNLYKAILSFSTWIGYGAIAQIGRAQAAAVLVNTFFNTVVNSALAIANSVQALVLMIAQNATKPISPQITKSYSSNNFDRCYFLMILSAKLAFISIYFISLPLLFETEFILGLWLETVPPHAVLFTRLIIVNILFDSLSYGISEYIFASGKIRNYQIWVNTLYLFSVPAAYFVLRLGAPVWTMFIVFISFTIIIFFVRQIILYRDFGFKISLLIKQVYRPCFCAILCIPLLGYISLHLSSLPSICYAFVIALLVIVFVCLDKTERNYAKQKLATIFQTLKSKAQKFKV